MPRPRSQSQHGPRSERAGTQHTPYGQSSYRRDQPPGEDVGPHGYGDGQVGTRACGEAKPRGVHGRLRATPAAVVRLGWKQLKDLQHRNGPATRGAMSHGQLLADEYQMNHG